jgi:hypothetical protein
MHVSQVFTGSPFDDMDLKYSSRLTLCNFFNRRTLAHVPDRSVPSRIRPMAGAWRLASEFPRAKLNAVPGAKTWVPVDEPSAVADAIAEFVPTQVR